MRLPLGVADARRIGDQQASFIGLGDVQRVEVAPPLRAVETVPRGDQGRHRAQRGFIAREAVLELFMDAVGAVLEAVRSAADLRLVRLLIQPCRDGEAGQKDDKGQHGGALDAGMKKVLRGRRVSARQR